jgi:hypothetical protein
MQAQRAHRHTAPCFAVYAVVIVFLLMKKTLQSEVSPPQSAILKIEATVTPPVEGMNSPI